MTTKKDGGADCGRGELLVSVLYGEATAAERAEFDAHRRHCASCSDEVAAFSGIREELQGWELGAVPHVRVEVKPGLLERLRRAFALLPTPARIATAGAFALLVLALFNTEVSVGRDGVSFRTGLVPRQASVTQTPQAPVAQGLTEEQVRQIVDARCDAQVRAQLAGFREQLDARLEEMQTQLVSAKSPNDVRALQVQIAAQRKRIEALQRDIDRTAAYGGSDLFSVVLNSPEPKPGT